MAPRGGRIAIAGGGLGGALMALYLGRAGYHVDIFERRPDPRGGRPERGRSINLAISTRGIHALREAGLADQVLARSVPMRGRMIHAARGGLAFQPYGVEEHQTIHSVSRAELNRVLMEAAAAQPNVRFHFGRRCVGADLEAGRLLLRREPAGGEPAGGEETVEADILIGADGAFSEIRRQMQRADRFEYSQSYLAHGYKELLIPALPGGGYRMEKNALHIWPRGGFMMIALPNEDGSFTCTCFWPFSGPNSFANLTTPAQVRDFFTAAFPDAVPMMPTLEEDFAANPVGSLVTVRCRPWRHGGRAVLLGDAAHAIVPFYGQGANAAFEDCVVLDACIRAQAPDWAAAFAAFEAARSEHVNALADLAIGNFFEMRDRTGSRLFRLGKKIEKGLHRLFPGWFLPLYFMVTFSRTPYADAVRRARRQWRTVGAVTGAVGLLVLAALAAAVLR